jgi:mitochondrial pyruvate carrier 2
MRICSQPRTILNHGFADMQQTIRVQLHHAVHADDRSMSTLSPPSRRVQSPNQSRLCARSRGLEQSKSVCPLVDANKAQHAIVRVHAFPSPLLLMASFGSRLRDLWNHPAGPKTIFFWAPTCKWGISIANLSDLQRDPDEVSLPMQLAVTATGLIWSKYSLDITPKNYNLLTVNAFMAVTGLWQLYRKFDASQRAATLEAAKIEPQA